MWISALQFGKLAPKVKVTKRPIDVTNESQDYWEKVLRREGLSMDGGRDPGHRNMLRIGNSTDVEKLEEYILSRCGKVKPEGHGPDSFEG